jgi:hypothetical protein
MSKRSSLNLFDFFLQAIETEGKRPDASERRVEMEPSPETPGTTLVDTVEPSLHHVAFLGERAG